MGIIESLAGGFELILGCDPDAPASDPCKIKARQYAAVTITVIVLVIVLYVGYKIWGHFKG